ncbi:hypothetical protein FORC67_2724 [Listeria monocytogenes]|nr:hypothetical protein FORC67_2724 [Listeria monocytogenes]
MDKNANSLNGTIGCDKMKIAAFDIGGTALKMGSFAAW